MEIRMDTNLNSWRTALDKITKAPDKAEIEKALGKHLPEGTFTVIVRNYGGGDSRSPLDKRTSSYKVLVLLTKEGRSQALQCREFLAADGFFVSERGDISLN